MDKFAGILSPKSLGLQQPVFMFSKMLSIFFFQNSKSWDHTQSSSFYPILYLSLKSYAKLVRLFTILSRKTSLNRNCQILKIFLQSASVGAPWEALRFFCNVSKTTLLLNFSTVSDLMPVSKLARLSDQAENWYWKSLA